MNAQRISEIISEIACAQHGVFVTRQLVERGVSKKALRHRVRTGWAVRLKHDIYRLRDHPWTWEGQLQALLFDAGPDAVVSHRSAARLHGFWRYAASTVLDVTVPEIHDHLVTLGRIHRSSRMPAEHRTLVAGFPVMTIARTCFDLMGDPDPGLRRSSEGREVHARNMRRVVNDALRHRSMTLGALVAVRMHLGKRGRPGSALCREIVAELGPDYVPTDSEGEDLFVEMVDAFDLPQPKRQVHLSGQRGWLGRVDFLYSELRLVVEVDGGTHQGPLDRRQDRASEVELRAEGYDVWRIPYEELRDHPERVARELRRRLNLG
ncbi:MAG: AbiEi antitoxin N-terminal domain-containing protein [Acidimicrobiales bacterium]